MIRRAKRAKRASNFLENEVEDNSNDSEFFDDIKVEVKESKPTNPSNATSRNRVENLRERIQLFYGTENENLVRAIQLRAKWGNLMFSVSPDELESPDESAFPRRDILDENMSALEAVSKDDEMTDNINEHTDEYKPGHNCIVNGVELHPHEARVCNEVAAILNVGYQIISMDWSSRSILAVGVHVTREEPINEPASFPLEGSPTLIYLYAVEGTKVSLKGTIRGKHGIAKVLQWRPSASSEEFSELCIVCGDGEVGVVRIDANFDGDYELELKPLKQAVAAPAVSACWRTVNDLVVGFKDGHIAEFSVCTGARPSYVVRAHASVITAMASGWPERPQTIFTTSVDGWSCVFEDVSDLRLVHKAPRLKYFTSCACYAHAAESFLSLEDVDTSKLVPWRKPELVQAQTTLTRHCTGISSLASSSAHPLIISGGQDGELHIANPLRRTMVTRRNRDVHMDCAVWRFECSHKTSEYRFVELLTASTLPKRKLPNHLPIYPTTVTISNACWKPNSTWYAAGTLAGIIRIENVNK